MQNVAKMPQNAAQIQRAILANISNVEGVEGRLTSFHTVNSR